MRKCKQVYPGRRAAGSRKGTRARVAVGALMRPLALMMMGGAAASHGDASDPSAPRKTVGAEATMRGGEVAQTMPVPVAAMPLRLGYYVAIDTPCGRASVATVSLVRHEGIGGSRDFCRFERIERTSPHTYRVTQACSDLQDRDAPSVGFVIYRLIGDARFTARSDSGWTYSARYCAQSSMPPEWRQNDLREPSR